MQESVNFSLLLLRSIISEEGKIKNKNYSNSIFITQVLEPKPI